MICVGELVDNLHPSLDRSYRFCSTVGLHKHLEHVLEFLLELFVLSSNLCDDALGLCAKLCTNFHQFIGELVVVGW
jgi:hypothetical protein